MEQMLDGGGARLCAVVLTAFVALGVGVRSREMGRSRRVSGRAHPPSSENQSGCSVAVLFTVNTLVYLKETPLSNFPPSPLFQFSLGGL